MGLHVSCFSKRWDCLPYVTTLSCLGSFWGCFAVQVWCVPKLAEDVAPDDYTKANKEGFADKIDEIRGEPQTLNILDLFFS